MTPEVEKVIVEKYPHLFANIGARGSSMNFGIEVGDGWSGIISTMCWILNQKDTGKTVRFDQIKEKWGLLRVYISGGTEYMAGVVRMAEDISGTVCEMCGKPGEQRKGGWVKTLCDGCHTSLKAREKGHEKRGDSHVHDLVSLSLTAEEREAIRFFSLIDGPGNVPVANKRAATLRGLLERLV